MSLRLGSVIGRYRVEATIGRGGMGIVYLATDLELERPVALKVLAPELAEDPEFRVRFLREARLAASIEHPAIVAIYDVGELQGQLLIAMRFVPGEDLGRILRAQAPLEPERVVSILGQVAAALDAAHGRGLVHRDVKPANILVQPDPPSTERAYLVDFGLTRLKSASLGVTRTGQLLGTIDSVAPEQILGGAIDGRTDQYSLACVLFQCLAGSPPFEADHEAAVLYAHVHEPPPRLSDRRRELPTALDSVIARGMAKDRDERYGSCPDLIADAREALTGMAGAAHVRTRVRARLRSVPVVGGADGRDSAVAAALGVLVAGVALLVAGAVAFSGRPGASPPLGSASLPGGAALVRGPDRASRSPAGSIGAVPVAPTATPGVPATPAATPTSPASPVPTASSAGSGEPQLPGPSPTEPPDGGITPTATPSVPPPAIPTPPPPTPTPPPPTPTPSPPTPTPKPTRTPTPTPTATPAPGPDVDGPPTGQLVFVSESDGDAEIYLVNASGSLRRLTDNGWNDRNPALSPDGRRVVFDAAPEGNRDLYVTDTNGSGLRRITRDPASDRQASWSPGGGSLVFISTRGGNAGVFVFDDADGSEPDQSPRRVTEGHADMRPSWAGSTIAFASDRTGPYEIWFVASDHGGSRLPGPRKFTSGVGTHLAPEFSPTGTWLASIDRFGEDRQIAYRVASGGPDIQIGPSGDPSGPTWSSDSRFLAYTRIVSSQRRIAIYDRTTGGTQTLDVGLDDASEPDWGPEPGG